MSIKLHRIIKAGEKLAAQLGGAFIIDCAKLADFQRREARTALDTEKEK